MSELVSVVQIWLKLALVSLNILSVADWSSSIDTSGCGTVVDGRTEVSRYTPSWYILPVFGLCRRTSVFRDVLALGVVWIGFCLIPAEGLGCWDGLLFIGLFSCALLLTASLKFICPKVG